MLTMMMVMMIVEGEGRGENTRILKMRRQGNRIKRHGLSFNSSFNVAKKKKNEK